MTGVDIEGVLSAHFVMWRELTIPPGPPGEWFCSCGAKFGFSHSAVVHVAAVLREQLATAIEAKIVPVSADDVDAGGFETGIDVGLGIAYRSAARMVRAAHLSDTERAGGAG